MPHLVYVGSQFGLFLNMVKKVPHTKFSYQIKSVYTVTEIFLLNPGPIIDLTHLPLDKMAVNLTDNIFKNIFMNENFCISIRISLKLVSWGPINICQHWFR